MTSRPSRAVTRATALALLAAALAACASSQPDLAHGETTAHPPAAAEPVEKTDMAAADGLLRRERAEAEQPPSPPRATSDAAAEPPQAPPPDRSTADQADPADRLVQAFPHIRINRAERLLEFDGFVPIDAHHPESPLVFLEVVACTRGTKEHEALVVTDAEPSQVHAALLMLGLEPGEPGSFRWEEDRLIPIPPTGDPVTVSIAYRAENGREIESSAAAWIKHAETGALISAAGDKAPIWVFAGSRFVTKAGREMYDADGAGTLVGLATFGSETIAFTQMISPEASLQEPVWVAAPGAVPAFNTPVTVRLRAAEAAGDVAEVPE